MARGDETVIELLVTGNRGRGARLLTFRLSGSGRRSRLVGCHAYFGGWLHGGIATATPSVGPSPGSERPSSPSLPRSAPIAVASGRWGCGVSGREPPRRFSRTGSAPADVPRAR